MIIYQKNEVFGVVNIIIYISIIYLSRGVEGFKKVVLEKGYKPSEKLLTANFQNDREDVFKIFFN